MRAALLTAICVAGCFESPPSEPSPRLNKARLPPIEPVAEMPPPEMASDFSLDDRAQLAPPIREGRLVMFPIVATKPTSGDATLTLNEAMTSGLVTITELTEESETVTKVVVRNRSESPVFILGGEIIAGGMQDRII